MKKIITLVGTSLFTKPLSSDKFQNLDDLRDTYKALTDKKVVPESEWDKDKRMENDRNTLEQEVLKVWETENASAEIASLLAISDAYPNEDIEVYFIATDTVVSRLAAQLITQWPKFGDKITFAIDKKYAEKSCFVVKGLSIANPDHFSKTGLKSLFKELDSLNNQYGASNLIINITGGYRGVIPYLTIYSQLKRIPAYYLYEDSKKLIRIPQAPIQIDWNFISEYSHLFREFSELIQASKEEWKARTNAYDFPQEMLDYVDIEEESDGSLMVGLNPIGEIAWSSYDDYFFVEMPLTCRYFKDDASTKRIATHTIQSLYKQLIGLDADYATMKDKILKHVAIGHTFLFKQTHPQQIRLQYSFDTKSQNITIYNYRLIINNYDDDDPHRGYQAMMKKQFPNLKDVETTTIGFPKI